MGIKHATLTAVADDPAYDIGSDEWNADHTADTITIATGTITVSNPAWNITQTWNAGAVTFTAMKLNVTNTASAAGSLLADWQVGSVSKARIDKTGKIILGGTDVGGSALSAFGTGGSIAVFQQYSGSDGNSIITTATAGVTGTIYTFDGVANCSAGAIFRSYNQDASTGSAVFNCLISATSSGDAYSSWQINGGTAWSCGLDNSDSDKFKIGPNGNLTATVGLSITTAGVVEVTTGIVTTPVTVANLPTGVTGMRSFVTDATQTLTAGIGAVVAGTGANNVPVHYDGTNWRIG
jgi:hypothetical protein